MKTEGITFVFSLIFSRAGAFLFPAANSRTLHDRSHVPSLKNDQSTSKVLRADISTKNEGMLLKAQPAKESDVVVFDAEGVMSWEEYKKQQRDEYKLSPVDQMLCWEYGECPVPEEQEMFYMKKWQVHSAERNPTTETHFDSEGEWEEADEKAWSNKWYEDVGADDLGKEPGSTTVHGYEI